MKPDTFQIAVISVHFIKKSNQKLIENWKTTQRKVPQFHLIFWCGNFMERYNFSIISGESPKNMRKPYLSIKFPHQEIRWNYRIFRSASLYYSHCMKSVHIRSFFWSVFSPNKENTDQQKIRIWTLFMLCHSSCTAVKSVKSLLKQP